MLCSGIGPDAVEFLAEAPLHQVDLEFEVTDLAHMALGLRDNFAWVAIHKVVKLARVGVLEVLAQLVGLFLELLRMLLF